MLVKVQRSLHLVPPVESHAPLNRLDFEKSKHTLILSSNHFSDVPVPDVLKMPPHCPARPAVEIHAPLDLLAFGKSKYALIPSGNSFSDTPDMPEPALLQVPPLWPALDRAIGITCDRLQSLLQ
jgi:hypothetical protein